MINTLSKINLSKIGWEGGGSTSIWIMSVNILGFFWTAPLSKQTCRNSMKEGGQKYTNHRKKKESLEGSKKTKSPKRRNLIRHMRTRLSS